jgi:hypothetical protein
MPKCLCLSRLEDTRNQAANLDGEVADDEIPEKAADNDECPKHDSVQSQDVTCTGDRQFMRLASPQATTQKTNLSVPRIHRDE